MNIKNELTKEQKIALDDAECEFWNHLCKTVPELEGFDPAFDFEIRFNLMTQEFLRTAIAISRGE